MSVLDTFYILFKTNSDDVKKGYASATAEGKKFDEGLGQTDAHVMAVGEKIKDTFKDIGLAIAGAFAAEKLFEFGARQIEVNAKLAETSERLGVAVEDFAALQAAASRFGGSADGVTASVDFLVKGLATLGATGRSRLSPFLDELGIQATDGVGKVKPVLELYRELAEKFQGRSVQERAGIGERFGLDPGMLAVLSHGAKGFDELIAREKALGVTTKEDAEAAHAFELTLADIRVITDHIVTGITSWLLPALNALTDAFIWFTQFVRQHGAVITDFFIILAGVITTVYLPAMVRAAIATTVALAPILLIALAIAAAVAAMAALALAVDDVNNFLAGNKSVIGELSKKWPELGDTIKTVAKDIGDAFETVENTASALWKILKAIGGFIGEGFREDFDKITDYLTRLGTALGLFGQTGQAVAHGIVDAWDFLGKEISRIAGGAIHLIGDVLDKLPAWLTGGAASLESATGANRRNFDIGRAQDQIGVADRTPLGALTPGSILTQAGGGGGARSATVTIGTLNVNAPNATDAAGVAAGVGEALKPHIESTINQFDDGVQG